MQTSSQSFNKIPRVMLPKDNGGYMDFKMHLNDSHNDGNGDVDAADHKRQLLDKLLYRTTKRFLIVSQIFLCAPAGVHKPRGTIKQTRSERLLYGLQLMWYFGVYMGLVACIYDEYTSSNIQLPTMQKPLYFSEYVMYMTHLLEIMLGHCIGRRKFWKFHDFFVDFDRKLLDFKLSINYLDLGVFLRWHMQLILLHFICTIIIGYFYSAGIVYNFLRTNTIYILSNVIMHISLIQYYALLFMIEKRLARLHHLLESLLSKANALDPVALRARLNVIRNLYARLEQLTRDVNDDFSYSVMLVFFGSYTNGSLNVFLAYKFLHAWSTTDFSWTAYSVDWICMHVAKMFLILRYNQRIQNEKAMTSMLLSTYTHGNKVVDTTIRHFIIQLMSDTRANVICGILTLNMTFLTSILVGASTLFIFLVQYDITFEALTKNQNPGKQSMRN